LSMNSSRVCWNTTILPARSSTKLTIPFNSWTHFLISSRSPSCSDARSVTWCSAQFGTGKPNRLCPARTA
jgi:hypothetical protein